MRPKLVIIISILILASSCDKKPLPPSLWQVSKSKKKFQKVLDYYSNPKDSLKLRAAEFLIENMDNHFSYHPKYEKEQDSFFKNLDKEMKIDSIKKTDLYWWMRDELMDIAVVKAISDGSMNQPSYKKRSDVSSISSEFLIENIEYAFKAWEFPWARSYTFDQFCTYILPYRYGNEPLSPWRKVLYEKYKWISDSLENLNSPLEAATLLSEQFAYELSVSGELINNGFKMKVTNQLDAMVTGNCFDLAGFGICVLRSIGIPSAIVKIPFWGNRAGGHEYCGVLDLDNTWRYFEWSDSRSDMKYDLRPPKMFLKKFDKMDRYKPILSDVSDKTMKVMDFEVEITVKETDEIFLCTFGNLAWIPICKGENLQSKAIFKDVGKGKSAYIVAVIEKGILRAVSDAFIPDTMGNISYYKPNLLKQIKTSFSRKYPNTGWIGNNQFFRKDKKRIKDLVGGEFSIAEDGDFNSSKSLYVVDSTISYRHNIIKCQNQTGKYFRYNFPMIVGSTFNGPAEIAFYTTENETLKKITGRYFASPQISLEHIKLMTDNDWLTYVKIWDCQKTIERETSNFILRRDKQPIWIGLEVDTPITITHVGICPRNDKNGVYPGMRYELLYWDNEWISLGQKVAADNSINFDGIPENALMWLRNLDEGEEERIFTLEAGEQVWW
jgi:hypothetical protein